MTISPPTVGADTPSVDVEGDVDSDIAVVGAPVTVKVSACEVPPPGEGVTTSTGTVPGVARSVALTTARS
jgi:hypothetical protein